MMDQLIFEQTSDRKLVHAYIALAWAQAVAQRYVADQSDNLALRPLLTMLDSSAKLLEEVLQEGPLDIPLIPSLEIPHSELVM